MAHAVLLRRFDALDGHDDDGYGTSAAWLAAIGRMSPYAETAACDAMIIPVVTSHADMTVIDKIIDLALAATDGGWHRNQDTAPTIATLPMAVPTATIAPRLRRCPQTRGMRRATPSPGSPSISSPALGGLASCLHTGLLDRPYGTPSLTLDIGFSEMIPASIRRAVLLRDKGCAAVGPPPGAMCITCITRRTAARPVFVIVFYCVSFTMMFVFTGRAGG